MVSSTVQTELQSSALPLPATGTQASYIIKLTHRNAVSVQNRSTEVLLLHWFQNGHPMKTVNRQHEAMLGMSECSVIFQEVVMYEEAGRIERKAFARIVSS